MMKHWKKRTELERIVSIDLKKKLNAIEYDFYCDARMQHYFVSFGLIN